MTFKLLFKYLTHFLGMSECSSEELAPANRCWCRDPRTVCWWDSLCFNNECKTVCPEYPKQKDKECVCDKTVVCEASQFCQEGQCKTTPAACTDIAFADNELGCSCISGEDGAICSGGQMCIQEDDSAECKDVGVCPQDSTNPTVITDELCYCNITNSLCKTGGVCDTSENRCVEKCPDYPEPNPETLSCKCSTSEAYCSYNELCGSDGCAPECPAMPEYAPENGCYCGETKCSSGDMCEPEEQKCWPDVSPCPGVHTTISDPACFCSNSESLCAMNQICNEEGCTEPYPQCPSYPATTESTCACRNTSLCEQGQLCSYEGVCREPEKCQNEFRDEQLQLTLITEDPKWSEGQNISLKCNDCHHVTDNPNAKQFDVYCKDDGKWNITVTACSPYPCPEPSVDTESVEETTEGDTCQRTRTFKCKNDLEYFEHAYGKAEVTFQCTSIGWNISEISTCSVSNQDNSEICTTPNELKCVFKVKKSMCFFDK